jgi:ATP-binding cassette subfamily F protein 3
VWAVESGTLEVFKGSWSEYAAWRETQKAEGETQAAPRAAPVEQAQPISPKPQLSKNEERKRAARAAELEALIADLERQKAQVTQALETAGTDFAKSRALGERYARLENEIASCVEEWGELVA